MQHVAEHTKLMHLIKSAILHNLGDRAVCLMKSNSVMLSIRNYKTIFILALNTKRCVFSVVKHVYLILKPHYKFGGSGWSYYQPQVALILASQHGYMDLFKYILDLILEAIESADPAWPFLNAHNLRNILSSAFFEACERGDLELVKLLADHPAFPPNFAQNMWYFNKACSHNRIDVVRYLLNHKMFDPKVGVYGFIKACKKGHSIIVKMFLEDGRIQYDMSDNEAFIHAVEFGHLDIIKMLIDVDAENKITRDRFERALSVCLILNEFLPKYDGRQSIGVYIADAYDAKYVEKIQYKPLVRAIQLAREIQSARDSIDKKS